MSTDWGGFPCGGENTVASGMLILTSLACVVTLSDTPGIMTVVNLPTGTRGVRIWTAEESLRVSLDVTPLPAGQSMDLVVNASVFQLGDTVLAGLWQQFAVPDDGLTHTLNLMSNGISPRVMVVALVE